MPNLGRNQELDSGHASDREDTFAKVENRSACLVIGAQCILVTRWRSKDFVGMLFSLWTLLPKLLRRDKIFAQLIQLNHGDRYRTTVFSTMILRTEIAAPKSVMKPRRT